MSLCGLKFLFSLKLITTVIGIVKAVPDTIKLLVLNTGNMALEIPSRVEMELSIICKSLSLTSLYRKKLSTCDKIVGEISAGR